jgi:hypothetical protein
MKYKYVDVTDERNTLAVDGQGQMDKLLPSLDQVEALFLIIYICVFL